jgi:hypothetical protein
VKRMKLQRNYFRYELTDGGWQQVSGWFLANESLTNEVGDCDGASMCDNATGSENENMRDGSSEPKDVSKREGLSERLLSIQVTEYSHDDRPDIWYKPEIVQICEDVGGRARAREQFIKYGLPAIIRQTCWADLDELRAAITKGLEQKI